MELKEIDKDAIEIYEAWKTGGIEEAAKKFNSIVDSKKLVLWIQIALKEKSYKLIKKGDENA